jgi:hypothetical protein
MASQENRRERNGEWDGLPKRELGWQWKQMQRGWNSVATLLNSKLVFLATPNRKRNKKCASSLQDDRDSCNIRNGCTSL